MIGRPDWFGFRYGGKDPISINPSTWQGWVYLAIFLGMIFVIIKAPNFWFLNDQTRKPLVVAWGIAGTVDILHIWYQKMRDRHGWGKK